MINLKKSYLLNLWKKNKNLSLIVLSDLFVKFITLLLFPIIGKFMNPDDFGLVSNFFLLIAISSVFIDFSNSGYFQIQYFNVEDKSKLKLQVILSLSLNLLFILMIVFGFSNYIQRYIALDNSLIFLAVICAYFQVIYELLISKLRFNENAKFYTFISILNAIFSILIILLLIYTNQLNGYNRVISSTVLITSFGLLSLFLFLYKYIDLSSFRYIKLNFKDNYLYGLFLLPHNLSVWLKTALEKLFISNSYGLTENGYYSFAFSFSSIFIVLFSIILNGITPRIYKLLGNQHQVATTTMEAKSKVVKILFLLIAGYFMVLILGFFVLTKFIIPFYYPKYLMSIKFFPYLFLNVFINSLYVIFSMVLFYSKKVKYFGIFTSLMAIIQVIIVYYFNLNFGEKGLLLGSNLIYILLLVGTFLISNYNFPLPWKNILYYKNSE